jgi:rod shape-determining protein MreD
MARITSLGIAGRLAVIIVATVIVQGILALKLRVFGYFDLPLICSVYYGFTLGNPIASIVIGSFLGLMQDSLSGAPLGTNGFSKTLIGFVAASAGAKFNVDQAITRVFALFLFSIGDGLLVSILGLMADRGSSATNSSDVGNWLLSATFNTLLGLALFGYHDRWSDATT